LVVSIDDWRTLLHDLEELRSLLDSHASQRPGLKPGRLLENLRALPDAERIGAGQEPGESA